MSVFDLSVYILKFMIPAAFSMMFRAFGLGYRSKKRLILGLSLYTLYLIFVPSLLIQWMGYGQYTHISVVVMTFSGMAVLIFSTDPPGKTIYMHMIQSNMVTVISVILNMVRHVLGLSYPVLILMLIVICPIVYAVALRFWAKPLRFIADNIYGNILPILSIPVLTMVIVNLIPVYPPQNFASHPVFCTIMMLSVELCFFLYLYTFYCSLRKISNLSTQEQKWQVLQSEIESYQEYLHSAKKYRHDQRHHDALLQEYLEAGDVQSAISYLQSHQEELSKTALKQYSQNSVANAVLRMYERKAQGVQVAFSAKADIPESLPMTASELGSMLGNMLENALEAAKATLEPTRKIFFCAFCKGSSLLISVQNSMSGDVIFRGGVPVSTKPNGGMGTKSVLSTVKKYGGMVSFSQEEREFNVRVVLPL